MERIEVSIKQSMKGYEKQYVVQYGYKFLFVFTNREDKWLFWTRSDTPFAIIESKKVPTEQITNLAVSFATIVNNGEIPADKTLYGVKITAKGKKK